MLASARDAARTAAGVAALLALAAAPQAGAAGWRDELGIRTAAPPAVTAHAPWLALLDSPAELTHPAIAGGNVRLIEPAVPYDAHGTATAAVAAATGTGGILGVWPGMAVRVFPIPAQRPTCLESAERVMRAVTAGAATINMSYGGPNRCFAELAAVQTAVRRGIVVVAAAGNERLAGNPASYPAGFPHVVTVAALDANGGPAAFSSTSNATDLGAPGVAVLTAVPAAFDVDGAPDGSASLSGTSFAAPMVAAAATWLRAARPGLTGGQISRLLCDTARDVPPAGWDRRTGCGRLDLGAALRGAAPPTDPGEPNDDVSWVDGTALGGVGRSVWRGGEPVRLRASVTAGDDPIDVYRVLRPAHSRVAVSLTASGPARLLVLDATALDVADADARLAFATARRGVRARVVVRNATALGRIVFVVVRHDGGRNHRTGYDVRVGRA